ncbi:MAG TPA: PA2169 family four-helix-bundle protein [Chitinophagaceae bacterium]|nr:PA2169 family four-helix-bundle protein [Chitinophagaceae bacterium]
MSNVNEKAIDRLNHLIAIANDGKYGYENAAEDVKDVTLKQMFRQYSSERATYAEDLKKEVATLGGSPDKGGGPLGALHRTWMDIKSTITSGDREAILRTCITGEEAAVKAYTESLEDENITGHTKQLISQQLSGVQFALNSIRSLAETVDN